MLGSNHASVFDRHRYTSIERPLYTCSLGEAVSCNDGSRRRNPWGSTSGSPRALYRLNLPTQAFKRDCLEGPDFSASDGRQCQWWVPRSRRPTRGNRQSPRSPPKGAQRKFSSIPSPLGPLSERSGGPRNRQSPRSPRGRPQRKFASIPSPLGPLPERWLTTKFWQSPAPNSEAKGLSGSARLPVER